MGLVLGLGLGLGYKDRVRVRVGVRVWIGSFTKRAGYAQTRQDKTRQGQDENPSRHGQDVATIAQHKSTPHNA
jgi:hypothetical protein